MGASMCLVGYVLSTLIGNDGIGRHRGKLA